jgi:N-acetylglucosamine malate deacetylase 1
METKQLRVLMIGAHPDDCEYLTGGIAAKFRSQGHAVKFVSATNGDTGHYKMGGDQLAKIRAAETRCACDLIGAQCQVMDIHSNTLTPDIHTRERFICLIREFKPDMIFTHRLYDYHPDHRYTSMLIQDLSYSIRVPNVCPLTPPLTYTPVILYMHDFFKKPLPFSPDVVVDIDDVFDTKAQMINCHKSQVYEWLPWMDGELEQVPADRNERLEWLKNRQMKRDCRVADSYSSKLMERYGEQPGSRVKCAEAFEVSEYGRQVDEKILKEYFPF